MKRIHFLVRVTLAVCVVLCVLGSRMLSAQDNLKNGTVVERTELKGAPGWEAILVQRILPPGAESGKHTQSGNEIVYIQEGSVIFEAQGKPAVTLKPGEAFTTVAGEVHNVKNTSSSAPAKALAFYVAKKGARLEEPLGPGEIGIAGRLGEETAHSEGYVCLARRSHPSRAKKRPPRHRAA